MTDLTVSAVATSGASPVSSQEQSGGVQGASEMDVSAFGQSLETASSSSVAAKIEGSGDLTEIEKAVAKPLDYLNNEAAEIARYAEQAVADGNTLSPSEIVTLTAKSHEFMFHAQLTANVANRTSEGLQQLFRQQG